MNCDDNQHQQTLNRMYRMDETFAVNDLLSQLKTFSAHQHTITENAIKLAEKMRLSKEKSGLIDHLLREYDLSNEEGIALMCLAEGLLRIPDTATIDKLIQDKLNQGDFKKHLHQGQSWLVNAATYSFLFTSKLFSFAKIDTESNWKILKNLTVKFSTPILRPIILRMMKIIGNQFVVGETIQAALKRSTEYAAYHFSFDMLGEAARTWQDADRYFKIGRAHV